MPFSYSSSLVAGLGKRTQKPLGAHQGRISIAMKENTEVCDLQPNYVSCIGNSTLLDLFTSMHRFTPIIHLLLLLRSTKQEEFWPQNKITKFYS
jgi:hypothetical protein